jgi:hypothetical protein
MKKYMELEVYIHFLLTSLLDGGERSASCGAALSPVYIEKAADWVPERVWTPCKGETSLYRLS